MTHYPPFKHFTLMEQTPTTASDSAAGKEIQFILDALDYAHDRVACHRSSDDGYYELKLHRLRAINRAKDLLQSVSSLQAEVAALKEECDRLEAEREKAVDRLELILRESAMYADRAGGLYTENQAKDKQIERLREALAKVFDELYQGEEETVYPMDIDFGTVYNLIKNALLSDTTDKTA